MEKSLLEHYVLSGGICMILLVPLSVYALGLILQSYIHLRRARLLPAKLLKMAQAINSEEEYEEFLETLQNESSPFARMMLTYLSDQRNGQEVDAQDDPRPIEDEADRMNHFINPLTTTYVVAPLLGLLGTVTGIIRSFHQYSLQGKKNMADLVAGIDEALVTTMWGLFIAIPAYFFHAMLERRIFRYERDLYPQAVQEVLEACAPYCEFKVREADSAKTA